MRAILLSIFLISSSIAYSYTIDVQKLEKMMHRPTPAWMQKQIQNDLEIFQDGFTRQMIENTISDVYNYSENHGASLIRYEIKNNKLTWYSPSESAGDDRVKHFIEFFQQAAKHVQFPDTLFTVCLWDSFDRPVYLEKTTAPVFAICKFRHNKKAVVYPEVRNFDYREGVFNAIRKAMHEYPWSKKIEKAFWRGTTSGGFYTFYEWDFKPRPTLVFLSKERPDLIDAGFTGKYYLEPRMQKWMEQMDMFKSWTYPPPYLAYKYLIAVDGNTFPSNTGWQLLSNSTVLYNESDYIEWYYNALEPYVHYIPYNQDCSDLEEKIQWLRANDDKARQIALNATHFANENLSNEAVILYFYKLLKAYTALIRN